MAAKIVPIKPATLVQSVIGLNESVIGSKYSNYWIPERKVAMSAIPETKPAYRM